MVVFTFSVFNRKYPFRENLAQRIKIVSLSQSLVPRLIRIRRIQCLCLLCLVLDENTLLGEFGRKIQNCLLKVKYDT